MSTKISNAIYLTILSKENRLHTKLNTTLSMKKTPVAHKIPVGLFVVFSLMLSQY